LKLQIPILDILAKIILVWIILGKIIIGFDESFFKLLINIFLFDTFIKLCDIDSPKSFDA